MQGFADSSVGKESACHAGDLGSIPGLGRSLLRRERLLTPVFWPGEFHGLCSPGGCKESYMTDFHFTSLQCDICIIVSLSIHLPISLGCFHVMVIVNNAALIIVKVFFFIY